MRHWTSLALVAALAAGGIAIAQLESAPLDSSGGPPACFDSLIKPELKDLLRHVWQQESRVLKGIKHVS